MNDHASGGELEEMASELLDRYEELTLLYDLGASLASEFDVPRLCEIAVEKAARAIGATQAAVALVDDGAVTLAASLGGAALDAGGITEHVASSGRELLLHESDSGPGGAVRELHQSVLSVPLIPPGEEVAIGALTLVAKRDRVEFTAGDAKLANTVATQLAAAIHTSRLVDARRAAESVRREMEIAAGIQRTLLPERPPDLPGVELAALYVPAATLGGDYYDFVVDGAGRVSVVIADVAGHSIGSALMMAMARSIVRRELAEGGRPATVLAATNDALFDDLVRAGLFITAYCARFDPSSGSLLYANAGHNPPLLRRFANGAVSELDADGAALGILAGIGFEEGEARLDAGDAVLLYTDGVTEAARADEQFGERRLEAAFDGRSPQELVDGIYAAVRAHAGDARGDDVTLVALQAVGAA
jgi:sigma-B regulation protein RsbU (phosphoserine phosphatase)